MWLLNFFHIPEQSIKYGAMHQHSQLQKVWNHFLTSYICLHLNFTTFLRGANSNGLDGPWMPLVVNKKIKTEFVWLDFILLNKLSIMPEDDVKTHTSFNTIYYNTYITGICFDFVLHQWPTNTKSLIICSMIDSLGFCGCLSVPTYSTISITSR